MNESIPPEFWQGVEQFNSGQFYACHDTLEALWIEANEPERIFYQGILQIAVALYHLGNDNFRGAVILLGEGSNRLRRYSSNYAGLDIADFLDQSVTLLHELQQIEPKDIASGDWKNQQNLPIIPKIVLLNK